MFPFLYTNDTKNANEIYYSIEGNNPFLKKIGE